MYRTLAFLFALLFVNSLFCQKIPTRIMVPIDGKVGYVDGRGELVISAKYYNGNHFSEGVAPVRENGLYGYINHSGEYVLPPAYDYAEPFRSGLARVWKEGELSIIDREGRALFVNRHAEVLPFADRSYATVKNENGRYGLIDRSGHLLVDTVMDAPLIFDERGLAVAEHHRHKTYDSDDGPICLRIGVVDTLGKFVVEFEEYHTIAPLGNGFFKALLPEVNEEELLEPMVILDAKGRVRSQFHPEEWTPYDGDVASNRGHIPVRVYHLEEKAVNGRSRGRNRHAGIMTADGKVVRDRMDWDFISPFDNRRAFALDTNELYWLIDDRGEILLDEPFSEIQGVEEWSENSGFHKGEAIVLRNERWFRLMPDNSLLPLPDFGDNVRFNREGDFCSLEGEGYDEEAGNYDYNFGWYDLATEVFVSPRYKAPIWRVSGTELLTSYSDDGSFVFKRSGQVVWSGEPSVASKQNIDFLGRASFLAHSPNPDRGGALGGHYAGGNEQRTVDNLKQRNDNQPTLSIAEKDDEYAISITNGTRDTFFFPAQDSRIELVLQAQTKTGEWKDIQYLPSSWCGNSYHTVDLPPGRGWGFTTTVYTGANATLIRPRLTYKLKPGDRKAITIYGNAVPGAINPAQFWRKRVYQPGGLMDPYND